MIARGGIKELKARRPLNRAQPTRRVFFLSWNFSQTAFLQKNGVLPMTARKPDPDLLQAVELCEKFARRFPERAGNW